MTGLGVKMELKVMLVIGVNDIECKSIVETGCLIVL